MKYIVLLPSLLIWLFITISQAKEVWTLEKCLSHAKENNIQIKQNKLNVKTSEYAFLQNKLALLPSLNGGLSRGYNFGRSIDPTTNDFENQQINSLGFSLSSNVVLFSGFKKLNQLKQMKYDLMASIADLDKAMNDITINIVGLYLQILFNKEMLKLNLEQLEITKLQMNRTEKLVEAGSIPEGDLLQIKANFETDKLNVITAKNQLDTYILELMILLELELSEPIDVETPNLNIPIEQLMDNKKADEILRIAQQTDPSIKSAAYKEKSFEKRLAVARGGQSPTVSIYGNISTNYSSLSKRIQGYQDLGKQPYGEAIHNGDTVSVMSLSSLTIPVYENTPLSDQLNNNLNQAVGISVSFPIFNGWATRTSISMAKIGLLNAGYAKQQAQNVLKQDIYRAYTEAEAASQKYVAAKKAQLALQKNHDYIEKKYNQGLLNFIELSTSKNNLNRANSELLQAKYEYVFKLKILDFYQGKQIKL